MMSFCSGSIWVKQNDDNGDDSDDNDDDSHSFIHVVCDHYGQGVMELIDQ